MKLIKKNKQEDTYSKTTQETPIELHLKSSQAYSLPSLKNIKNLELKKALENKKEQGKLVVPLGVANGKRFYYDITEFPNLVISGTIMSGKSNFLNSLIISLITCYKANEVKLVLIDPKQVEFSSYSEIPHLLLPVISDSKKTSLVLQKLVNEMNNRYQTLVENNVKRIEKYNELMEKQNKPFEKMPYIVIIIDGYTTIIENYEKSCSNSIEKLSELASKVGIYLIFSINHYDPDTISSLSLFNFPSRLSFYVPSTLDSRIILGKPGAENLNGIGESLLKLNNNPNLIKLKTFHIDDSDINTIINEIKKGLFK